MTEELKQQIKEIFADKGKRIYACEKSVMLFSLYYFSKYHFFKMPEFHKGMYEDLLFEKHTGYIWEAFRESGKTTLAKIGIIHSIVYNTKHFITWTSYDQKKAESNLFDIALELQTNNKLIADFGQLFFEEKIEKESKKKSIGEFITKNKIKVKSYSVGQSPRGEIFGAYRPDFSILDDIETSKTITSLAKTQQVIDYMNELLSGLAGYANVLVLCNKLTNSGSISYLKDKIGKNDRWFLRSIAVKENGVIVWKDKYVQSKQEAQELNDKIEDKTEHKISLDAKIEDLGETIFYREMMNQPLSDDDREFHFEWLQNYYEPKQLMDKLVNRYITIDVADSKERENRKSRGVPDYTGTVVVDWDIENNWYIRFAKRKRVNSLELIDWIFYLWETYRPLKIGVEKKSFEDQVKPYIQLKSEETGIYPIVEELEHGGTRKEDRIRGALQGRCQAGKVKFLQNAPDNTDDLKMELFDFPRSKFDDLCLVGNTQVATIFGNKNIKDINIGDKLITPFGIRSVLASKFTGYKEVISNIGLTGTPNHKIFNNNNFDKLDTIEYNNHINKLTIKDLIIWKYKKLLLTMEQNINLWEGKESIISVSQKIIRKEKVLKDYTWQFGNFITKRKFQKALKFTIKMAILLITTLTIWNVYRFVSIAKNTGKKVQKSINKKLLVIYSKLVKKQKNGTGQMQEENGTLKNQRSNGKILNNLNVFVKTVKQNFNHFITILNFVPMPALLMQGENQELMTKQENVLSVIMNLGLTSIQRNLPVPMNVDINMRGRKEKVYNLTVEGQNVYYANNILVGNCDALAYIEQLGLRPIIQGDNRLMTDTHREFYKERAKRIGKEANPIDSLI